MQLNLKNPLIFFDLETTGIDIVKEVINDEKYDAVVLCVAHHIFLNMDIRSMLRDETSVVYDVKGTLDRTVIDGRL